MNNIQYQFDIEKAKNGEEVQIFNHILGDWSLLGAVYWIGVDLRGYVLYQFPNDIDTTKKTYINKLRMKPKTAVWWFRTYVNKEGIPGVCVSSNITEFSIIKERESFKGKCEWVEEAWSKEIPK